MAPMTRSFSPGGVPASNVADYYVRRAKDEVGLIVSEGTVVNRPPLQMIQTFRTSTAKSHSADGRP
jgi:2,4-dienoyl-CoA reductase-like NADH-dependent reductase (Old Yellow Enzyme family)